MKDNHYAAIVGISRYPELGDLSGPVNDANDFYSWLTAPYGGGVPSSNVKLIMTPDKGGSFTRAAGSRPVKFEVDEALRILNIREMAKMEGEPSAWNTSRLYIYLAGHGILPEAGDAALLFANAATDLYENLELRSYLDYYRRCGIFREVVAFADCCRNWIGIVGGSGVPFLKIARPQARVYSLVGYASGPGDPAYEEIERDVHPDDRRGYFTKVLLAGLKGAARLDPDRGAITSTTLAEYVSPVVENITGHLPCPQHVDTASDPGNPIVLVAGGRQTFPVDIRFPSTWPDSVPCELLHPNGDRERVSPVSGVWHTNLSTGLYAVLPAGRYNSSHLEQDGTFMIDGITTSDGEGYAIQIQL